MAPRPMQQPAALPQPYGGQAEQILTHPAYGQLTIMRVSGDKTLYDSSFDHGHFMAVRLHASELHRGHATDRPYARKMLAEFQMSEGQWARLVSSVGSAEGVACTITHANGTDMPSLPPRRARQVFSADTQARLDDAIARVDATIASVTETIGGSLSQAKRVAILNDLHRLRRDLDDRIPFIAQSLEEHMDETVETARLEITAHVAHATAQAGLTALTQSTGAPRTLSAGAPTSDGD